MTCAQLSKEPQEWLSEIEDGEIKDSLLHLVMQRVAQPKVHLNSLPRGTTPAVCLPPRLRMAFVRSAEWEMPIWEIDKVTRGRPLSAIVLWVLPAFFYSLENSESDLNLQVS